MSHYLHQLFQALDFSSMWDAVLRVAAIFLCLTVHETCHGLAALALGGPHRQERTRISLNPLRHIDWFGLLFMFVAGFGWAKPVPVDPRYFRHPKRGMAVTSWRGPSAICCWRSWRCCWGS
jgi:Zn-dependent protease